MPQLEQVIRLMPFIDWHLILVLDLRVCFAVLQMKLTLSFSWVQYLQELGLLHGLTSISLLVSPSHLVLIHSRQTLQ